MGLDIFVEIETFFFLLRNKLVELQKALDNFDCVVYEQSCARYC